MKIKMLITLCLVLAFSVPAFAEKTTACSPPYQPTNIFKLLINYSRTLDYLSTAPDQCQKPFKQEVTKLVQSTWMFSEGCKEATFKDFNEAEKKREGKTTLTKES